MKPPAAFKKNAHKNCGGICLGLICIVFPFWPISHVRVRLGRRLYKDVKMDWLWRFLRFYLKRAREIRLL
jgi:hypothetical protein